MDKLDPADPYGAPKFAKIGYGVLALVFGGLALWSVLAPINGAVIASGKVVIEGNRKTIQHLIGGVVEEILVTEGDFVNRGDILVRLDKTEAGANLGLIDEQLAEFYARRARLTTERDQQPSMGEATGVSEILEKSKFSRAIQGQKNLFEARRATRLRQLSLLRERIVQQENRVNGLKAQRQSVIAQLSLIKDEIETVRSLYEQGFAALTRLRSMERENERLSGELGSLVSGIAEAESTIAETNLEIERLNETFLEETISELRDVEVQISELEERRIAVNATFKRTTIVAPTSGEVMALNVHTIGGVVAPGETLLEIVPDSEKLEIEAKVSPSDIEKITVGQEALIRFSAFSLRTTPEVDGNVKSVSADSLIDELTGASYYLVLIEIPDKDGLQKALGGQALVPGMPGEAYIKTGKQPAISYILRPLTDALARSLREE